DSRLTLLPHNLLATARVLGCNDGLGLLRDRHPRRVVGIDIDDVPMCMALRRRRTLWSHQAP
ncbi:hypothetical protein EDB92DRAFT_1770213, partial [Lactarius akahatsu]